VTDHSIPETIFWTTDSREIVFSTFWESGETALWRVSAEGGEPRRIATRGAQTSHPTTSRNRLAYVSNTGNRDIWRLELAGKEAMKPPSEPLLSWSSDEAQPVVSPDGRRIAFVSNSSGSSEIWVCNNDGTKPVKLTDMRARAVGSPSWHPDGKLIAFDSTKYGNLDIFVVSAEGGPVRRITTDPTQESLGRWSKDGRWLYFWSDRSGSGQIWKMPSEGGKAIQIAKDDGSTAPIESVDGYVYYYSYDPQKRGVWRVPAMGGAEQIVTDVVGPHWWQWNLTDRGIYFVDGSAKPVAAICLFDFATRRVTTLAPVHKDPRFITSEGPDVAPDGKWLVYSGGIFTSDIMLIDNFR